MGIKVLYLYLRISPGPEEFLKIHRVHLIILLVSNGIGLNLFIVDAHQGTGADHVVTRIRVKGFEGRSAIWTFLKLVKEEECLVRNELPRWLQQRYILNDCVHFISVVKDGAELLLQDEVNLYDRFIVGLSEGTNRNGLPNLSGALDNKGLTLRILFPCSKYSIYFPFQQIHNTSHFRKQR